MLQPIYMEKRMFRIVKKFKTLRRQRVLEVWMGKKKARIHTDLVENEIRP